MPASRSLASSRTAGCFSRPRARSSAAIQGTSSHRTGGSDLSYVGRLRGYQDISESTNLDVGGSYARGHNPLAHRRRCGSQPVHDDTLRRGRDAQVAAAAAVDLSLVRRPLGGCLEPARGAGRTPGRRRVLCVRRLSVRPPLVRRRAPRQSDRADAAALRDGGSVLLTYWPSEFSQIRGQYRRTTYAEGATANEFLFQFQFSIGAHGAHPF